MSTTEIKNAANWLDQTRDRFLGLDTADLSLEQLRVAKGFADEMVRRLYAEIWGHENSEPVPAYGTPEWEAFYDRWLASE